MSKKYKGDYVELVKMEELCRKNDLNALADQFHAQNQNVNVEKMEKKAKRRWILMVMAGVIIANLARVFLFEENTEGKEPIVSSKENSVEANWYAMNEAFLNGYHIEDEGASRVLMNDKNERVIENIIVVKYTMSQVLILYADDQYISYDTLSHESIPLDYEDIYSLEVIENGENKGYGLAVLKDDVWYLADLYGNIKAEMNGNIKGANCIELIDGKPTFKMGVK